MQNLLSIILAFVLSVTALTVLGQVKRTQLEGDWQTNNEDSLYYKSDSLAFHLDSNHWINIKTCKVVSWRTEKGKFKFINISLCTEPGRESRSTKKEKLLIKKRDYGQVIELKGNGQIIDQFKLIELNESRVNRYPYDIKQLTVLRFDNIMEQKLYNHVDSLVFEVLGYEPSKLDSTVYKKILKNAAATASEIIIRDSQEANPKPLLIINGKPVEYYEILKMFLFVEATAIKYMAKEQATSLYGYRAINGVILLQVSSKKFNKIWRKYGG